MWLNRTTGKQMSETPHIKQSIVDIVTTLIGTRVMRRFYGTIIPGVIDKPMNEILIMQMQSSIFMALDQYEHRIKIASVYITEPTLEGTFTLNIEGSMKQNNNPFSMIEEMNIFGVANA